MSEEPRKSKQFPSDGIIIGLAAVAICEALNHERGLELRDQPALQDLIEALKDRAASDGSSS